MAKLHVHCHANEKIEEAIKVSSQDHVFQSLHWALDRSLVLFQLTSILTHHH